MESGMAKRSKIKTCVRQDRKYDRTSSNVNYFSSVTRSNFLFPWPIPSPRVGCEELASEDPSSFDVGEGEVVFVANEYV